MTGPLPRAIPSPSLGAPAGRRLGTGGILEVAISNSSVGFARALRVSGSLPVPRVLERKKDRRRLSFAPMMNAALHGVTGQDSSLASGVQSTMQQVGGALGLACLVTLALRHAATQVSHGVPAGIAAADGYAVSFRIGAVLLTIGGLLALALLERVDTDARLPLAETELGPTLASADALASPAAA